MSNCIKPIDTVLAAFDARREAYREHHARAVREAVKALRREACITARYRDMSREAAFDRSARLGR